MKMRIFEYAHRLKDYLTEDGRVPYDTGNLQKNGFRIATVGANQVALIMGDARQVPYAIYLETGFRHYITGKMVTKHKGWASRGAVEFAQQLAQELGGVLIDS